MTAHVWTTHEYLSMAEVGTLAELPVELLGGAVVDKPQVSPERAAVIRGVMRWFAPRIEHLLIRMPIVTADGWVPEPDLALVPHGPGTGYPSTAWLVVEVEQDVEAKLPGYALGGVERVWGIDISGRTVTLHEQPRGERFERVTELTGDDLLDPGVDGIEPRSVEQLLADARV